MCLCSDINVFEVWVQAGSFVYIRGGGALDAFEGWRAVTGDSRIEY